MVRIIVLPGDGIGPEITASTVQILALVDRLLGLGLSITSRHVGFAALRVAGSTLPPEVLAECREADGVVLGPVSTASYPPPAEGGVNPSATLRLALDLYANIRPARTREGLPHWGRTPMDLVIVRENTEGFYADRNMYQGSGEFLAVPGVALSVRKITAEASTRIARTAFALAQGRRRQVTAVHKSNVLGLSEGVFLDAVRSVAAEHPDIEYDEQLVDSMAALLVRDAARFDVVVTTNMFGDILSDEASELAGSLGLAASVNVGRDHCMAQAQHGSAPDIAGRDQANPVSLILSSAMLLGWLATRHGRPGLAEAEGVIEGAVDRVLRYPALRTRDLGGPAGTRAFTDAVGEEIRRAAQAGTR